MNTSFNSEQSLALIHEMIQQARNNFGKAPSRTMMFWGYLVAFTAIANVVLYQIPGLENYCYMVWLLMLPGALVSWFISRREHRNAAVKTHIDTVIGAIWTGYGIGVPVFLCFIYILAITLQEGRILILITPTFLTMMGTAHFVTASACKNRPWYAVAMLFWAGALACMIPFCGKITSMSGLIILAVCMLLGSVLPGHILNYKAKKGHV